MVHSAKGSIRTLSVQLANEAQLGRLVGDFPDALQENLKGTSKTLEEVQHLASRSPLASDRRPGYIMSIRLVIADDHEVVRSGLINLLGNTEIEVVGEASDGEAAVELVLERNPDVVLMDIRMGGTDGPGGIREDSRSVSHHARRDPVDI